MHKGTGVIYFIYSCYHRHVMHIPLQNQYCYYKLLNIGQPTKRYMRDTNKSRNNSKHKETQLQ